MTASCFTIAIAIGASSDGNYVPLNRAGTVAGIFAFLYVLAEEVWKLTPRVVADEVENTFKLLHVERYPETEEPVRKFWALAEWAERSHKIVARSLEVFLVLLSGLLSGFGDLLGPYL